MTKPTISVVMPVYNGEAYLAEAIQSILDQSFTDFEFIIVDDGSTDHSAEIIADAVAQDDKIVSVRQDNAGIVASLNRGIDMAKGHYIARMDADDIAMPDRFEKQVAFMDAHPEVVASGGAFRIIDSQGRTIRDMRLPADHDKIDSAHLAAKGDHRISHPAVIMRTDAVKQIAGYNTAFTWAEDIDLWLRLAEIGRLANIPDIVLKYRVHLTSVGYTKRQTQRMSAWAAARDAAKRRGLAFEKSAPASQDRETSIDLVQIYGRWAWWSLQSGNLATAWHYTVRLLLRKPYRLESWRLLYCVLRGH